MAIKGTVAAAAVESGSRWGPFLVLSNYVSQVGTQALGFPDDFAWPLFAFAAFTGAVARLYLSWSEYSNLGKLLKRAIPSSFIGLSIAVIGTLPVMVYADLPDALMPVVAFGLAWGWELALAVATRSAKKWGTK